MEVVTAKLDENGTVVTEVDTNFLKNHHRRTKRSAKNVNLANFQPEQIDHKVKQASTHRSVLKNQNILLK